MGSEKAKAFIIIICGIIGIVLDIMLQMMYSGGIIVDGVVSDSSGLVEIQVFVLLFWLIVGGILARLT